MSEFLSILTHGRKLQGATKELTIDELESVCQKLQSIIEQRKIKELQLRKQEEEKQNKLKKILQQIEEAGLVVEDLQPASKTKSASRSGSKRPIKYKLVDDEGKETMWTGIGRMPKVFANALADGNPLSKYSV